MTTKKPAVTKETASAKSEAPPKLIEVWAKIAEIIDRLEKLETTVNAIRADFKSKGIPMP